MPIIDGMNEDYIEYFSLEEYINRIKLLPRVLEHLEETNKEFDSYMNKLSKYDEEYIIRPLTTDDAEQYNALLRYAFQVTEAELAETGWKDDEIKQSKFPVLQRADVLGCFDKNELIAQFAVYPLDMNIYGIRYNVGFVTSVCTYPEYTGHGIMKKLMIQCLTRMREGHKSFALLYPYSIPLYRNLGWEIISNKMTYTI